MHTVVVDHINDLLPHRDEWDALAVATGSPAMSPSWLLAWWSHMATADHAPRVVLVHEEGRLIGIAPYYTEIGPGGRVDYKPFAAGFSHRLSPLATLGRERAVARAVGTALAQCSPTPDFLTFEAIDHSSDWPSAIAEAWPGRHRPWTYEMMTHHAPVIEIGGKDFDSWMNSRSGNFRQQMRRGRRNLERAGGTFRSVGDVSEIDHVAAEMMRLHHQRWDRRGGSGLGRGAAATMVAAARDLVPAGRMRVWVLEIDSQIVCVQVLLSAGGETFHWNGGFDEAWAAYKPAIITIYVAVQDCFERGDSRIDLSGGEAHYKLRFANADDPARWCGLAPKGLRYPLTRATLVGRQMTSGGRSLARRCLSDDGRAQLRRALGR